MKNAVFDFQFQPLQLFTSHRKYYKWGNNSFELLPVVTGLGLKIK